MSIVQDSAQRLLQRRCSIIIQYIFVENEWVQKKKKQVDVREMENVMIKQNSLCNP